MEGGQWGDRGTCFRGRPKERNGHQPRGRERPLGIDEGRSKVSLRRRAHQARDPTAKTEKQELLERRDPGSALACGRRPRTKVRLIPTNPTKPSSADDYAT